MGVPMSTIDIKDENGVFIARAKLPDYPVCHYCGGAKEPDSFQCRKRPFRLSFSCFQCLPNSEETKDKLYGNQLYADTGESFVYKRLIPPAPPIMPRPPMDEGDFDNVWGTQIRTFTSPEGYLDDYAFQIFDNPPTRLLRNDYLDKTAEQVEQTEMERAMHLQKIYAPSPGDSHVFCVHRALRRTQIRYYEAKDKLGNDRYCAVGAEFEGTDLVIYRRETGITDVPNRNNLFGNAPLAYAYSNDVLWETKKRFAATFMQDEVTFEEFKDLIHEFVSSVGFSRALLNERSAEEERLRNNDYERAAREREASRRMLAQMKADHARREAQRAQLNQMRAEQRTADRARRDSWNRQQELDRRRRNAWSDAIRGVDRYEHPYDGGTIEVRTGYGQRAYYNSAEDRVITADSDLDVPFGYEELKRKD